MTIVPDTKDWTWVLQRRCPECSFETESFGLAELPGMIRANAAAWQEVLGSGSAGVATPQAPGTWSPLEYGCHVRDVLPAVRLGLSLMLAQDDPLYPNWDQDETAVAERYGEQDPAVVSAELRRGGRDDRGKLRLGAGRPVVPLGPPRRRRPVHHRYVRALLHPRPGAPPV